MRRLLAVLCFCLCLIGFSSSHIFAQTAPTPTTAQPLNNLEQQITNLKDKIASRVAQLKLVDKRGIIGTATDVSQTQITMTDINNNTQFIDVDELTKFSSPDSASFGISDITKGTKIGVLGLYNKDSKRILARFVDVVVMPLYFTAAVSSIDKTNYNFTVVTQNNNPYTIDVELSTKTVTYNDTTGLSRAGFSKIVVGERVSIVGFTAKGNAKEIVASRIILFPTIPVNPTILIQNPQLNIQTTVSPTAGSSSTPTPVGK